MDSDKAHVHHCFRFLNSVPLNKSSKDPLPVNFLEYWETDGEGSVTRRFGWVTDIPVSRENAFDIMWCRPCPVTRAKFNTKRYLWERIRSCFNEYFAPSMEVVLHCIVNGIRKPKLEFQ